MAYRFTRALRAMVGTAALLAGAATPALAGPIATYFAAPTGLSPLVSNGTAILADDFVPAHTGWFHGAIWWGSAPPADSHWAIAFYANSSGHPGGLNPETDVLARVEVGDSGFCQFNCYPDSQEAIWRYTMGMDQALEFFAGTEYWFSVTNLAPGWRWAEANGAPVVGTQNFSAQGTDRIEFGPDCLDPVLGANGVPLYCYGPWVDKQSNFSFLIIVPEPGSLLLAGTALLLLALGTMKTRKSTAVKSGIPIPGSGQIRR